MLCVPEDKPTVAAISNKFYSLAATAALIKYTEYMHDVSIQALSHREKTGASFADFAASAKELTGNKD